MIQHPGVAYALHSNSWHRLDLSFFNTHEEILETAFFLAEKSNKRLDCRHPFQGGHYFKSLRWHAVIAPVLSSDLSCCLNFRHTNWGGIDDAQFALDRLQIAALNQAMEQFIPLVFYGPTGAGKTTFLCKTLKQHCLQERVIVIETLEELPLLTPLWTKLVARTEDLEGMGKVTLETLLSQSLRMRPDRLVIGELRDEETDTFIDASLTGHRSVMTTMHAGSDEEVLARLNRLRKKSVKTEMKQKKICLIRMRQTVQFAVESIRTYDQKWY